MCNEKIPDKDYPFHCNYDSKTGSILELNAEEFDQRLVQSSAECSKLLAPTCSLHVASTIILPWLENKEHVMLVGPECAGK